MNRTSDRPSGRELDPIGVEARLLEANRRVSDAERAAAALRRRAEAAEVRVAEARERVTQERSGREEALAELTALLDAERRRGTDLAESLQDQLAESKARLSEAESSLLEEREERSASEEEFTGAAHARLASALGERDSIEARLSAELEEREGDVRVLGIQLSDARATLAELKRERTETEERLDLARAAHTALEDAHAELERSLETERQAVLEATERVEAATLAARQQAEHGKATVEEIQHRLAGELQRREQLLLSLRDAEHRAAHTDRIQSQLERRERELAAVRAEARGGSDATAKLQADIAVLQHRIEQGREELQAERIGRGTAEAILDKARQDHQTAIGTAEAVLVRERSEHQAALKHSEGQAQAALDAERSSFARERTDLESRVQRAVAEAEATVAGERGARQQERNAIAGSLSSLRTDIESTIGALREKLEGEITRTRSLTGALEQRHDALTTENQALIEARAGVEQALQKSEERAVALDAELTHRRDLMERVGTATAELRGHLDETRKALLEETARRESTELAAREVIAAAQNVLLARADEDVSAEEAAAIVARYAEDESLEELLEPDDSTTLGGVRLSPAEEPDQAEPTAGGDAPAEDDQPADPPRSHGVSEAAARVAAASAPPAPPASEPAFEADAPAADLDPFELPRSAPSRLPRAPARKLSDVLPGPAETESAPPRPSAPAMSATAPVAAEEGVDDLSLRFDRIRAQLAERGIRSARAPGERTPGGPR